MAEVWTLPHVIQFFFKSEFFKHKDENKRNLKPDFLSKLK